MDAKRKRLKLHRSNVNLRPETEVSVTVEQIPGCLGLQHRSVIATGAMARDSGALHALGSIHLDEWEMCFQPLAI